MMKLHLTLLQHKLLTLKRRPRDWADGVMYGTAALVLVYFLWIIFRWGGPAHVIFINDVVFLPLAAAAVLLSLRAALRATLPPRLRRAWLIIACAHLLYGVGEALWYYWEAVQFVPPFPSSADAFYLLSYPFMLWGICTFPVRAASRSETWEFWLDALTVCLGGWSIAWFLILGPAMASPGTDLLTACLSAIYITGDLIILVGTGAYLLRRWTTANGMSVVSLMLGAFFTLAGDLLYTHLKFTDTYEPASITDTLWMLGRFLYVAAAYSQCCQAWEKTERQVHRPVPDGVDHMPIVGVVSTYITLWYVAALHANTQVHGVLINVLAATALLILRQVIVLRTNRRLLDATLHLTEELRSNGARFRSLVQNASDVVLLVKDDNEILYRSPSFQRLFALAPDSPAAAQLIHLVCPEDRALALQVLQQLVRASNAEVKRELHFRRGTADSFLAEVSFRNLLDDPDVAGIVITIRDITEQKAMEDQLRHQAFHDSLTNLVNLMAFRNNLNLKLARLNEGEKPIALLLLDLDGFKLINDSMGHLIGDQLLVAVAQRLLACVRGEDMVARLGGDEFAILMEGVERNGATQVAWRIIDALSAPFLLQGKEVFIHTSMGIAISACGEESADDMIRNADVAMYAAKKQGKGRCEVFEPHLHAGALDRLEVEADLRRAIKEREMLLWYQPVVSMATGRLVGVEALVRWRHPSRGLLSPGDFIPLAEETGLIFPLGEWVLQTAAAQFRRWQTQWPDTPCRWVSVNISGQQLNPDLVRLVDQTLTDSGIRPNQLMLEITESELVRSTSAAAGYLRELKQLGVRLAIDDFGTGYSSLSYLAAFPVDLLKIDRSFVQALRSGPRADALLAGILNLARGLNLKTIAEGVEEDTMLADLRRMGCDLAQGYYISRPQPPDAICDLLKGEVPIPQGEIAD